MATNTYRGELTLIKIQDGQDGAGIINVYDFYILGQSPQTFPTVPDIATTVERIINEYGWSLTVPEGFGKDNPVIWNFKRTEYGDGKVEHSEAVIASFWATAPEVLARYCATQESDISKWESVYDDTRHNYIIFSYDGGQTWTPPGGIRIKGKVSVDEEAVIYNIISSQDEILRYIDSDSKESYFSPGIIEFQVQREYIGLTDIVDFVEEFKENEENQFKPKLSFNLVSFANLNKKISSDSLFDSLGSSETFLEYNYNENKISLDFEKLYQEMIKKEAEAEEDNNNAAYAQALYILNNVESFLEVAIVLTDNLNNEKIITKKHTIRYSTNYDLAQLSIYAGGIVQSVQDTKLVFDAEGLTAYNGGIKIYGDNFIPAQPNASNFNDHDYYILTDLGYVKQTEYIEGAKYYEKQRYKAFGVDDFGNLYLKGTGEFSGKIIAKEGEFTGEVRAKTGSLENLNVNGTLTVSGNDGTEIKIQGLYSPVKEKLASNNKNVYYYNPEKKVIEKYEGDQIVEGYDYYIKSQTPGIYSNNFNKENMTGFWLDPDDGKIWANNIAIGDKAEIQDSIYLKSEEDQTFGVIRNPNKYNGVFIEAGKTERTLKITTDGNIYAGDIANSNYIVIKGADGIIQSGNYAEGISGWRIDNLKAEFNDIIARGTLKAVTFEQNEVSTVGGTLLLRPSAIIKQSRYQTDDRTKVQLVLEGNDLVFNSEQTEYYFRIGASRLAYRHVSEEILENNEIIVVIEKDGLEPIENIESFVGQILIGYGAEGDIGIGINSSNSSVAMPPQAISVFETGIEDFDGEKYLTENPKIILGKITDEETCGLAKYGLYADQVNVKGELTSKGNGYYSGINSNSTIPMSQITEGATGNIIFWAGAKYDPSFSKEEIIKAIQEAPFQVDTLGNIYASSGFFQGEIQGSVISTSVLKAAVIEGIGPNCENDEAALIIRNAQKGIEFEEYFQLTNKEMLLDVPLNMKNGHTSISKDSIVTSSLQISALALNDCSILMKAINQNLVFQNNDSALASMTSNGFYSHKNTYLNENIYFGEETLEYRQIIENEGSQFEKIIGYDLYIKS